MRSSGFVRSRKYNIYLLKGVVGGGGEGDSFL